MPKLTVESATLKDPKWPGASIKPGTTTTIKVDAPQIKPDQFIEFRIRQNDDIVDTVKGAAGATSATWNVPNLPHDPTLKFDAVLTGTPTPKSGFQAVLAKVTSPEATLQGFKVTIDTLDAAFVPHNEKIQVTYTVTDPGSAATNGRFEVWGERYPDNKPLYTENFTPAAGQKTWNTWDGKANFGKSNGKYISPEFSPYRVRIIIGVNQGAVDDAFGAGISQVAAAEAAFEVVFQSVTIGLPLPANYTEAAAGAPATAKYTLAQVLAIDRQPNGTYTAMGRLPNPTSAVPNTPETCRIRIPMACHQRRGDALDQGTLAINSASSNYFPAGGQAKHDIDALFYTRPEIPIEFKLFLRSRDPANNTAPNAGVYDKEAVGPAKLEPYADDTFAPAIYSGGGPNQLYWRKAAFKIKDGLHYAPVNSGAAGIAAAGVAPNSPVFKYWEARFEVAADGQVDFNLDNFDTSDQTYHYQPGNGELTIFLNRTKLVLGASQAVLDKGQADYIEVDTHTIKLRANFTKAHSAANPSILWVMRSVPGGTVADWNKFPPGTNCHHFYSGIRGTSPLNGLFKKTFSSPAASKEPVIGKATGTYPYAANNFINLHPDSGVAATDDERVEISAVVAAGPQQGLAGVLFSPSFIAGDRYTIRAFVNTAPYERNLGWEGQLGVEGKTGILEVWRVMLISDSQRLPDPGTVGLNGAVGCAPEQAIGSALRPYIGDGVNMDMTRMNTALQPACNEWTIAPPDARLPAPEVHKNVNLDTYRAQYMAATFPGQVPMSAAPGNGNNGAIRNDLVPIDAYRIQYPPGFPTNRQKIIAKFIHTLPAGTPSSSVRAQVQTKLAAIPATTGDDWFFGWGVPSIALSPASWGPLDYFWWVVGLLSPPKQRILDAITPQSTQPKEVKVVRWPFQHEQNLWDDGANMTSTGMTLQGEYIGNSQSDFITGMLDRNLFQHEMGHSAHLVHFVGGNFGWKHHNILQTNCMMSYNWPIGFVPAPAGAVGPTGAGTARDKGWPHRIPPLATLQALKAGGHPYNIDPAADPDPGKNPGGAVAAAASVNAPCIRMDAFPPNPPADPCAKCILKLRGWQELVLPVAWNHPDLY